MNDKLLNETEVAEWLGVSVYKLQKDRQYKRGLPWLAIGRCVRYSMADIQAYLTASKVGGHCHEA